MAAAARELSEETGVTARPLRYLKNIDVIINSDDGAVRFHFLLAAVLCDYVSGEPVANEDASAAEWVPVQDILNNRRACSAHVDNVILAATRC